MGYIFRGILNNPIGAGCWCQCPQGSGSSLCWQCPGGGNGYGEMCISQFLQRDGGILSYLDLENE